jgi:hypothetical protein
MCGVQATEERAEIRERVKAYIVERNAREGTTGSSSSDTETPATPATANLDGEDTAASSENLAHDGVDN